MTNQTPINPKKAWGVTFLICLIGLTIFGSFLMANIVTVLLIAIPLLTIVIGAQNKVKSLGWIVAGIVLVELLAVATGALDSFSRHLADFGGAVQCLSFLILLGWGFWTFRSAIARKLDIPEGTGQAMADAAQQAADEAKRWLRK